MDNIDLLLLFLSIGGSFFLMIVAAVKYLMKFHRGIKYDKKDMPHSDGFISMILPSMLGICLCTVCFVGGTFAWFTASNHSSTQPIVAADYVIEATVDGKVLAGSQTLQIGTHTVTLKASGTAMMGYCIIDLDGTEIHTVQIPTGSSITFILDMRQSAVLTIISQWGSSSRTDKIDDSENPYLYPYSEKEVEDTVSLTDKTEPDNPVVPNETESETDITEADLSVTPEPLIEPDILNTTETPTEADTSETSESSTEPDVPSTTKTPTEADASVIPETLTEREIPSTTEQLTETETLAEEANGSELLETSVEKMNSAETTETASAVVSDEQDFAVLPSLTEESRGDDNTEPPVTEETIEP